MYSENAKYAYNSVIIWAIQLKLGEGFEHHKRRHTKGRQAHEKMLSIINHYRNVNQNHNEYHHTFTRMAEMKETDSGECGAAIFSKHCWWGCKVVQPLWKTVCQFIVKLNICLTCDPAIVLLDVYCERFENIST